MARDAIAGLAHIGTRTVKPLRNINPIGGAAGGAHETETGDTMAKIFHVKVFGKEGDNLEYDVQAKDDAAARAKAIKLWVNGLNRQLAELRKQEHGGDTVYRGNYSDKDVSYCEVRLLTETSA